MKKMFAKLFNFISKIKKLLFNFKILISLKEMFDYSTANYILR